ncbi:hypothetical protein [Rubellimicrobium roseum]|uniref:Uncharacterized protein n=1 Tax=Rubellimicrobium roseum TaxID=687525 RepID=A0A5C4NC49_9RHOB|nr:hypothetical protein [Rubellimicrobium roseum]TNC63991.1 hypothetical protein FHG71_18815 [Rubellimicrobium roseum]
MAIQERPLYASSNGDSWSLARDTDTDCVFVRHRPNLPSGGNVHDSGVGDFLTQPGHGPEKQELLHLIGSLIEDGPEEEPEGVVFDP